MTAKSGRSPGSVGPGGGLDVGRHLARMLGRSLRLMVGQPDYETYRAHLASVHPERAPMTRAEFFRDRERARYGAGSGRCC